jgi:DNA-binding transcriptional LysR family regulator
MNAHDLEAFIAVVETGSIVAASAKLNLTQPGITRRIQNLEAFLGGALLDRTAKPLKPTAIGRNAYDQGRQILQGIEDLRSEVAPGHVVRGEMRLGLATYLPEPLLCDTIDAVRGLYPDLALHVVASWTPRLIDQVQRGELDAATVCLPEGITPPEPLLAEDLGVQNALFVASPRLDLPASVKLWDLARHPWIVSQDGCGFRALIRRRLEMQHLPFAVAVESLSLDLRMGLVARGLGIGIATTASVADPKWADAVRVVDAVDFQPRVRCWLIRRQPLGRLERPLGVFRDAIAGNIRADGLSEAA